MVSLLITPSAQNDLEELWDIDEDSAAEIETALEEISYDVTLMSRLTERRFRHIETPSFDTDRFVTLWQKGLNLYRLKFWDWQGSVVPYRVIYAHNPTTDTMYVLAVVSREFNYDIGHPIVTRVRAEYERLGIPTY